MRGSEMATQHEHGHSWRARCAEQLAQKQANSRRTRQKASINCRRLLQVEGACASDVSSAIKASMPLQLAPKLAVLHYMVLQYRHTKAGGGWLAAEPTKTKDRQA